MPQNKMAKFSEELWQIAFQNVMHQSFEIPAPPTSGLPEAKAGKSPCFHHFNIPL